MTTAPRSDLDGSPQPPRILAHVISRAPRGREGFADDGQRIVQVTQSGTG
jgi:hypothetical protein